MPTPPLGIAMNACTAAILSALGRSDLYGHAIGAE
jgi:hypothetical protein